MSDHSEPETIDTQELAKQFLLKLAENNLNPTKSESYRETWTPAITKTLVALADSFECEAWPKYKNKEAKREGGWVLDVVWKKGSDYCLGVESELGHKDEVLDDFEKLLWTKFPIKILIFVIHAENSHKELHQQLREYIEQHPYHQGYERYLFFEINFWGAEGKPPRIHVYEFCAKDYLASKRIKFLPVLDTPLDSEQIEGLGVCEEA